MVATNVRIQRNDRENNLSVLRRFRNRVRSAGIIQRARGLRFLRKAPTGFQQKAHRLKKFKRQKERERLYKLGKISDL